MRPSKRRRARGAMLIDATVACSLAVVLMGLLATETWRQKQELTTGREKARARAALLTTYEELRAHAIAPPAKGSPVVASDERGVRVTIERVDAPDAIRATSLVAVLVRATWRDESGKARSREMTTLVDGGAK